MFTHTWNAPVMRSRQVFDSKDNKMQEITAESPYRSLVPSEIEFNGLPLFLA